MAAGVSWSDLTPYVAWAAAVVVIVVIYRGKQATTKAPAQFVDVDPSTLEAVEFFWRPG
jgi:hypothetical protein